MTAKPGLFDRIRLPRSFVLLHPFVGFGSIPAALVWLDRRLRLPRLPAGFCRSVGTVLVIFGVALTSWAVVFLMIRGKGAPNPDHPPRVLVEQGPYRYSRNPMVAGAFLGLLGVGFVVRSPLLLLYIPALGLVAQLYHVRTEEPELVERFGQAYVEYRQRVPRWLPTVRWARSPARR